MAAYRWQAGNERGIVLEAAIEETVWNGSGGVGGGWKRERDTYTTRTCDQGIVWILCVWCMYTPFGG